MKNYLDILMIGHFAKDKIVIDGNEKISAGGAVYYGYHYNATITRNSADAEGGGAWGVEFSDAGGYWGAGVPTGNQSPSGDFSAGTPEYSFIVELGNIDSSDNWTTVATSAATAYSDLGDYIHQTFDINPGQLAVWTPTQFTAVPEPSGGLLTLMGVALLALRRRRMGEVA